MLRSVDSRLHLKAQTGQRMDGASSRHHRQSISEGQVRKGIMWKEIGDEAEQLLAKALQAYSPKRI